MLQTSDSGSIWPAVLLAQENGGPQTGLELPTAVGLTAIILLVLLNGFFVATEFALVAVRKSRIEQLVAEGHRSARAVKNALEHLDTYIAATQLGITMASLALGWLGEPALAHLVEPLLGALLPAAWIGASSHAVAVAISFALITTLHIVLGELAPKGLALQKPEATALAVAIPTSIFLRIFRPFIMVLNGTGNLVLRLMGLRTGGAEEQVHSVEELRYLVRASGAAGIIDTAEEEIAGRALFLGDIHAHNVMIPRTEMNSVPTTITREALFDLAGREKHVRFPVYGDNSDDIRGIVYLTDVLAWQSTHRNEQLAVTAVMRKPLFVPESITGDRLLAQMRAARTHTCIVVDEFGGVAGLITLQDLLERIVGDIPEADEEAPPEILALPDGAFLVDGMVPLRQLAERFALDLGDMDADTVGGYVLEVLGRVPNPGDEFVVGDYRTRISRMDGPRIAEIMLQRAEEAPVTAEDEADILR
jgi:putative hemolysin